MPDSPKNKSDPTDATIERDEVFMREALIQAQIAAEKGEVPVGAVMVYQDEIISRSHNQPIATNDPSAHAEMMACRAAAAHFGNYRLPAGVSCYVTLEPCAMCAGVLLHARCSSVVFAASDPKTGVIATCDNLLERPWALHQMSWRGGVLAEPCRDLLQSFFKARRG